MQKGTMCSVLCRECRGIGCSNSTLPDESDGEDRTGPERTEEEGDS